MKVLRFTRRKALALLLLGAAGIFLALKLTPFPFGLLDARVVSTEFVDREGRPLRTLLAEEKRYAQRCALGEISPYLIQATLRAEDERFRFHPGFDPIAIARAVLQRKSGASTITQQLVKLSAPPAPRTIPEKLREIWLALRVELTWSKDQILEEYLNRLPYGNLQTGVAAASRFYFGKPPADLSPAEGAFLAALPNAPGRLNPHEHFPAARARQLWVLGRLGLNPEELARATAEPLRLVPPVRDFAAPHFVDLLLHREGAVPAQGGQVRTTLDLPLTTRIESILRDQLASIADRHATGGAVVVIANRTGEVHALASSGGYFQPGTGQINGATISRSPGSALKPFTYLLALERGDFPGTVVPDVPTDFPTETGLYRPNNYNHRFYGPVSLRFALGNSLNVAAIRTLERAGGPDALHAALRRCGLTTLGHPASYYGLGLTLGNAEVRLLELTNAFATLARLGEHRPYRLLRTGHAEAPQRVFDARAAYLLADMLADNSARAASFGLESYLRLPFPVACKTGTSSDYRDNWALGYTPEWTVGVWVGNPDGSPMRGITGVTGAAPVLHATFLHLHSQRALTWFDAPRDLQTATIHPLTGRTVSPAQPGAVSEKCFALPEPERPSDRDAFGRVQLDPTYGAWLASSQNSLGDLVAAQPAAAGGKPGITNPLAGSVYFLDPDLPPASQLIPLQARTPAGVTWSSPTLRLIGDHAQIREGRHEISARDPLTGESASTWIVVEAL